MRIAQHTRERRGAFTLVELLVVIAIIAILVSMLLAAVMKFMVKGTEITVRNDLQQLASGVESFKAKFKVYPPSRMFLSNNWNDYQGSALGLQSLAWLNQMFPRLGTVWNASTPTVAGLDWSGNGTMPQGGVTLEGDQCLVFFLGGITTPDGTGVNGFSTMPTNPTLQTGDRIPPFFNFTGGRLYQRGCLGGSVAANNNANAARVTVSFFSFKDAWAQQPYLFFSSNKTYNGYSINDSVALLQYNSTNSVTVSPYFQSNNPVRFVNPNSCQIICAGQNGAFGQGGLWSPATADTTYSFNTPGFDDMANFYDRFLGVPTR
jgi:prepilin-type N-terminal cleavage/methylation domain-containing protein